MVRIALWLVLAGCATQAGELSVPTPAAAAQELKTVAESSGFTRTATHEEVIAFIDELAAVSDRVRVSEIGRTNEGRAIPLVVVGEPPVATADDARRTGKLVALLIGNIHAGEVCGKEALLMLARELALAEHEPLLDRLVVAVVPIFNADGNERFSPDNRPGQIGPDQMGVRYNAQGLDLNRDFVKLEAPETRALIRFVNEWDPALIIDTHTTNGSHHRYTITYSGPTHPAGDNQVIAYARDTMLPQVSVAMKDAAGYDSFFYGNFANGHTQWRTYGPGPRYASNYFGLRNRLSILSEAYAYAPFEDRVRATLAFCRSCLSFVADHQDEVRRLVREADERTVRAGRVPGADDQVALRTEARARPEPYTVFGFQEYDEQANRIEPGEPREYQVEIIDEFIPVAEVPLPAAYLLPAGHEAVVELLQRHGLAVEILREDIEIDAEAYRIDSVERSPREYQGHHMVRRVEATALPMAVRAEAGWYVVRTAQKNGALCAFLLEPESEDGLATWNAFDPWLEAKGAGGRFPVLRVPSPTPMTTRAARPLPEDRVTGKRITYGMLYESRERPNLDGSPVGGLDWDDAAHYFQRKDGDRCRVDARTGRCEPAPVDTSAVQGALASLPTISDDAARSLARRFSGVAGTDSGEVVEYENDLYWARGDGSEARRLTSTPQREELYSLSPDGQFAAFIRDNNLFVVDVATATERALTTGGHDDLRYGKASWVYFEEVFNRNWRTYWWSPDSQRIVFFETDSSMVPRFTIVDDGQEPQNVETARYPRAGEANPMVRVGIAARTGGDVRWVDLSDYDAGAYLVTHAGWTPDSKDVRIMLQDRAQTWLDVSLVGIGGGKPRRLFRDRTEAWIEPPGILEYLSDGSMLISSERDGFQHLYHYDANGKLIRRVTEGPWEVRTVHRVDEKSGWIYFSGTKDSEIAGNLYRVRLDGSGPERLTHAPGSHRVSLSPDGSLFIDTWSSYDSPTKVALRDADGSLIRWIDTNPVYELDEYDLGDYELIAIESDKDVTLWTGVLKPPGFDPSRTYPVWFSTYGGPHAPTISDSWSSRLWDQMLAGHGIVVFHADPYPASGQGAQSAWTAYRQFGVRELEDITEAISWLKSFEWIDGDRIGMEGHSYGGFMTAFALTHSELFCAGIAGAAPTDWRLYDTIYTERYMDTPMENPEGYERTSVVAAAQNVHGRLLITHGTMDDNVHMQNAIRLISALQRADKPFETAVYPGSRHGIWGTHYTRLRYEFILRNLLGPSPEAEARP